MRAPSWVPRIAWKGGRPKDRDEARARILRGVLRCAATSGLAHFTINDVAEEVGIKRTTVYRFFKNREDLLDAFWLEDFS